MSHGHDTDHEHDDAAEAHDDHGFDGEPARELSPGEPMTPLWMPVVGAVLFVLVAVYFLATSDAKASSETGGSARPAAAAQTVAAPVTPRPLATAAAAAADRPAVPRKISPDQLKDLQRRIQEQQKKKQAEEGAK